MTKNPQNQPPVVSQQNSGQAQTRKATYGSSTLQRVIGSGPRRGSIIGVLAGAALLGGIAYWALVPHGETTSQQLSQADTSAEMAPATQPAVAATPVQRETAPTVYFATNSPELNTETRDALDAWAERLTSDEHLVLQLEGHCDERGSTAYNQHLGQLRANAAKAYLVAKGITPQRLHAVSFGETRPAVQGHEETAWAQNRRVEMRSVTALSSR